MIAGRSVLALIPARGGSRRLPGKNIRPLQGKPLIAWSIESARALPGVDDVIVSTDDEQIAQVSRDFGAHVPFMRPAALATDTAPSAGAISHALQHCAEQGRHFDVLLLLQPTSPFRDRRILAECLDLCIQGGGDPVVGFAAARSHPAWCFTLDDAGRARPVMDASGVTKRSQDLGQVYEVSGNVYAIGVDKFERDPTFFTPATRALVIDDRRLNVDIDDEFDWLVAQAVAASMQGCA